MRLLKPAGGIEEAEDKRVAMVRRESIGGGQQFVQPLRILPERLAGCPPAQGRLDSAAIAARGVFGDARHPRLVRKILQPLRGQPVRVQPGQRIPDRDVLLEEGSSQFVEVGRRQHPTALDGGDQLCGHCPPPLAGAEQQGAKGGRQGPGPLHLAEQVHRLGIAAAGSPAPRRLQQEPAELVGVPGARKLPEREIVVFLPHGATIALPDAINRLLGDAETRAGRIPDAGPARLIQCEDAALAALVLLPPRPRLLPASPSLSKRLSP